MFAAPIVITGPNFHFFARRQAEEVGVEATVVIEPLRRDSGARHRGRDRGGAQNATRTPWCWRWPPTTSFWTCRSSAPPASPAARRPRPGASSPSASSRPSRRPATATSCRAKPIGKNGVHAVKSFVEKPDAATAARYVRDGYLWNSGNFLFRADVLLSELARLEPEMAEAIEAAVAKAIDRPRLPAPAAGGIRARAAEIDRLCGDGKDRPRRGGGRRLPLVGHRQLGCAVRHHAARRSRQCRAWARW